MTDEINRTMTIFWLLQLQRASLRYAVHEGIVGYPLPDDFHQVLLHSPELMYSGLWRDYYSKDFLFTPDAKEQWCLPDVQPLPAVAAVVQTKAKHKSPDSSRNENDQVLEYALAVVKATFTGKVRRGGIIKRSLPVLQSTIMRRRASDTTMPPYSDTQVYFWIQYFHAAVMSIQENISQLADGDIRKSGWKIRLSSLTLKTFKTLFGITGREWKGFYSEGLWKSVAARMEHTTPDLKPLPNVITVPLQGNLSKARLEILRRLGEKTIDDVTDEIPGPAQLSVLVAAVFQEVAKPGATLPNSITSHAQLLSELYDLLINDNPPSSEHSESQHQGMASRIEVAMKLSGLGVTHKIFWIQQLMSAAPSNTPQAQPARNFAEFLDANPKLAFEGLPLVYYSVELWDSQDAMTTFVAPDRGAKGLS